MIRRKEKVNPVVSIIATMRLARALDCSYEEAAKKMKNMNKADKRVLGTVG